MKQLIVALSILAFAGAATGCSSERRTTTSTRTVETAPADPIVVERRSSTHTETRTSD